MMRTMLVTGLVALAAVAGYIAGSHRASAPGATAPASSTPIAAFVCPMHPHIVQRHPGTCPICGMDLVAAQGGAEAAATQIHVDTATQQRLGVRLARAERTRLTHAVRTYGMVVADPGAVLRLTPQIDAVLTRLFASRVGQRIAPGEPLYEIASDSLLVLQNEYIDVVRRAVPAQQMAQERRMQHQRSRAAVEDEAQREQVERGIAQSEEQLYSILQPLQRDRERVELRLRQIGFTDAMLKQILEQRHALTQVVVRARSACVVQEVIARPGMQLSAMSEIVACADPARNLLELVLYPDQIGWVATGDAVTIEFDDGRTLAARLPVLSGVADRDSRGMRVYLPLREDVRIGETALVTIATTAREVLAVPKSALIRTGQGSFVMRALGRGHYAPVPVRPGIETDTQVAIRDGLAEGDEVAVNGQFLLDAAASLADAAQRLARERTAP